MINTEGHAFADQAGRVEDLFDFGRADAVPRGLHHLVAPTDEIQKTFTVPAHGIAGKDRIFGQLQPTGPHSLRQQLEALGRLFGVIPIAAGDQRSAVYELTGLVNCAGAAVLAQHQDLSVRYRLADRIRSPVDFFGRQIG